MSREKIIELTQNNLRGKLRQRKPKNLYRHLPPQIQIPSPRVVVDRVLLAVVEVVVVEVKVRVVTVVRAVIVPVRVIAAGVKVIVVNLPLHPPILDKTRIISNEKIDLHNLDRIRSALKICKQKLLR